MELHFHKSHGKTATVTAAKIRQRFGIMDITENREITSFREKSKNDSGRMNVGFMVLEPKIFDYLQGDRTVFEKVLPWKQYRSPARQIVLPSLAMQSPTALPALSETAPAWRSVLPVNG